MSTLVRIRTGDAAEALGAEEHGYICVAGCEPEDFWWVKDNINWHRDPKLNRTFTFRYIADGHEETWYPVLEDFEIIKG